MKSKNKEALGDVDRRFAAAPGTSEQVAAADDMWESLGFASPQMDGIDQRAEEFIARFRAEMEVQETMARRL